MFSSIEDVIETVACGGLVIVTDDEDRENEGDFVFASEFVTPEKINFLTHAGRGLICITITEGRAKELELPLMVRSNSSKHTTAFTVSVDDIDAETGISAKDRYLTIKRIADEQARPSDLVRPGHIFPLIAKNGGVMVRRGHTEASVDLMKLAGLSPCAVICEILNEDGSMARVPDLLKISQEYQIPMISIDKLVEYILKNKEGENLCHV